MINMLKYTWDIMVASVYATLVEVPVFFMNFRRRSLKSKREDVKLMELRGRLHVTAVGRDEGIYLKTPDESSVIDLNIPLGWQGRNIRIVMYEDG